MADVRRVAFAQRREIDTRPDRVISQLAARQHGVVATWQLRTAGVDSAAIARRTAAGLLIRLHRGVHAVGHPALTADGRRLAAVLAGGPGAALSHRSAAEAWGLLTSHRTRHEITVAGNGGRRRPGVDAHRCRLAPEDVTDIDSVPVTTVARTLLDLAEVDRPDRLARALARAEQLRLLDVGAIDAAIGRAPGRHGIAPLRDALAIHRPEPAFTRSRLERRALALIADAGLPRPRVNAWLHEQEVDLLWPDARLVVELDGRAHHADAQAFEDDRRRDASLQARGYRVLRFTHARVQDEPEDVVATIAVLLTRASP